MVQHRMERFELGQGEAVEPDVSLVLAPNPSPMTYWGTNTYIIGTDELVIIDPGPRSAAHLKAVLSVVAGRPVSHVLLTHSHVDHSGGAAEMADSVDAPMIAFGPSGAGQRRLMQQLASEGHVTGGEGVDHQFVPDVTIADGETLDTGAGRICAIHTPGHMSNHMCFAFQDVVFSGDHAMEWATSMVSPPDGDLGDFMKSCQRLLDLPARRYFPGHGMPIEAPKERLQALIDHRLMREAQILNALTDGPLSVDEITRKVYDDLDPKLLKAASRNVLAHLIDLTERDVVHADGNLSADAVFHNG